MYAFQKKGDVWKQEDGDIFEIFTTSGGLVMCESEGRVAITGGRCVVLDEDGEIVTYLDFPHHATAPLEVSLPDWFVLCPLSDLVGSYWTISVIWDTERKGEGCWVDEDGCCCPRYGECIQYEPPNGCTHCDEHFSKFAPLTDFDKGEVG